MIKLSSKGKIAESAFIAENATILGNVEIGEEVGIWYNAVLRGDFNLIKIGDRCNVQDNVVVHVTENSPCTLGNGVSLGHGAIIHGATIEDNVLVGMGAVVMDNAVIGANSIIAAGAVVSGGAVIPPNSLVVGVPGKVKKELPPEAAGGKKNADVYVELRRMHKAEDWEANALDYVNKVK
ncbi:MAG: gamma carbonic anhydrase family protein [Firmicutes bacterium]|nr:gamma carbonic anhydrase family protein [Bacillota bacterium]